MRTTPFSSFDALTSLMEELHDERFDADTVSYNQAAKEWTGQFLRRIRDSRETKEPTGFLRSRYYFPVAEITLVVNNVGSSRLRAYGNAAADIFIGCERTASGCRLRCALFLDVELDIDGPITGEVRERELERRGYVDTFLGAERMLRLEGLE